MAIHNTLLLTDLGEVDHAAMVRLLELSRNLAIVHSGISYIESMEDGADYASIVLVLADYQDTARLTKLRQLAPQAIIAFIVQGRDEGRRLAKHYEPACFVERNALDFVSKVGAEICQKMLARDADAVTRVLDTM
jgi:hypothetical protein